MYERTTAYYNWILDNTKDATYCNNPFWYTIKKESTTEIVPSEPSNNQTENENLDTTEKDRLVTTEQNQESIANKNFKFNSIVGFSFIYLKLMAWLF